MSTILITGGTGLLGQRLTEVLLAQNHTIHIISRAKKESHTSNLHYFQWNIAKQRLEDGTLDGVTAIFHLAGAPVAKRWTQKYKQVIINSRVQSAKLLLAKCKELNIVLDLFHGASGINIYKPNTTNDLIENAQLSTGFLGDVCKRWETASQQMSAVSSRIAISRIPMILAKEDGALVKMLPPFKRGVAPYFARGQQYYSWVVIDDLVQWFVQSLENSKIKGVFNTTGGPAVSQKAFNKAISIALNKKTIGVPVLKPALQLTLGKMHSILTDSHNVVNKKAINAGFSPKYDTIEKAMNYLLAQ